MNIICEKEEADVPALASNSKTDEILDGANHRILDTISKRRVLCLHKTRLNSPGGFPPVRYRFLRFRLGFRGGLGLGFFFSLFYCSFFYFRL